MDSQPPSGNSSQVVDTSDKNSEPPLQFETSVSGSGDYRRPSEHDFSELSLLKLSGRVISVTFIIPYKLQAPKEGDDWVRISQLSLFIVLPAGSSL